MDTEQTPISKIKAGETKEQLSFLLSFYKPYALKGIIALIIMLITASLGLIFPAIIGKMLDGFVHPDKAFMPLGIQLTPGLLALSLLLLIAIQLNLDVEQE